MGKHPTFRTKLLNCRVSFREFYEHLMRQVGMHEPVSPIMLALVLRQIMPSLNIAQVPTLEICGRVMG